MLKKVFIPAFLALALSITAFGQFTQADSTQEQTGEAIDLSHDFIQLPSHLYNGFEYVNYDSQIEGHQFFESPVLEEGAVMYDGILYRNVPMLYDIVKDEVVIEHFYKYYKIRLISERVSYFTLLNHTFVWLAKDEIHKTTVPAGFYEILYDGQVKVLAKKAKRFKETIENQRVIRQFMSNDQYFMRMDQAFHLLKGKQSVIQALASHKKEIRQFIKQHRLTFKSTIEQDLASISQFYDKLQSE